LKQRIKHGWRALRQRYWLSLGFDVVVLVAVLWAIHAYQTRNLPLDQPTPVTRLVSLTDGRSLDAVTAGQVGVVYFFAPWCGICRHSIGNLDQQLASRSVDWATAIALDFESPDEVRAFVTETGISMPVLLGNNQTGRDWEIQAYPTYYVVDDQGRIASRSVGFSTWLGLRTRVLLSRF